MKLSRATTLFSLVAASFAAMGDPPRVDFTAGTVTLHDVRPGTHIAWMAMLIDQDHHRDRVRVLRGVDVVTPGRTLNVAPPNVKPDHGMWTFASIEGDVAVTAAAPQFAASTRPIDIGAVEGASSLVMSGARAEVLYVRKGSVWKFSAADGGGQDSDALADGRIAMALSALEPLHGNRPAPAAIERGDVILLIDFTTRRTATITVGQ